MSPNIWTSQCCPLKRLKATMEFRKLEIQRGEWLQDYDLELLTGKMYHKIYEPLKKAK